MTKQPDAVSFATDTNIINMEFRRLLSSAFLTGILASSIAQYAPPDPSGFQGLIVETYYVADANDAADEDGGVDLDPGEVTYRVYADLKPGYKILTVGGFPGHPLTLATTTTFFNNEDRGEAWGQQIGAQFLDNNTVAIDSWLTLGAASSAHWGVLKSADPDGSIVGGVNNDGGSNSVPGGLLVNNNPVMGAPLTTFDGLWDTGAATPSIASVGTPPDLFSGGGSSSYTNDNFAWTVLGGLAAPDTANRILLGQFTSDGEMQLCFNLAVRLPDELVCPDPSCHEFMYFYWELLPSDTAGGGVEVENLFTHPTLCFNSTALETDCEGVPGGPALPGTPCDDGDPTTANDSWQENCLCSGSVGINEQYAAPAIAVRPNPTSDQLWIDIDKLEGQRTVVYVTDLLGARVLELDLGRTSGKWTGALDLSGLAQGTYLLHVGSGDWRSTHRINKL